MECDDILTRVLNLLQHQRRLSYGALKRRYELDDDYLDRFEDRDYRSPTTGRVGQLCG